MTRDSVEPHYCTTCQSVQLANGDSRSLLSTPNGVQCAKMLNAESQSAITAKSCLVEVIAPPIGLQIFKSPDGSALVWKSRISRLHQSRHVHRRQTLDVLSSGAAQGALQLTHLITSISNIMMVANRVPIPTRKATTAIVIEFVFKISPVPK